MPGRPVPSLWPRRNRGWYSGSDHEVHFESDTPVEPSKSAKPEKSTECPHWSGTHCSANSSPERVREVAERHAASLGYARDSRGCNAIEAAINESWEGSK